MLTFVIFIIYIFFIIIYVTILFIIGPPPRPSCNQVYNLFHPTNPCASRIEPLLSARFAQLSPINIPRYQKYPLGDGQSHHICKFFFKIFSLIKAEFLKCHADKYSYYTVSFRISDLVYGSTFFK